jgi:hypothetical protein
MDQTGMGIDTNVGFHAEVPLIAFLGLVHLGVTLALLVLGGAGRFDDGGVYDGVLTQHQSFVAERGVDARKDPGSQVML